MKINWIIILICCWVIGWRVGEMTTSIQTITAPEYTPQKSYSTTWDSGTVIFEAKRLIE